ncbi:MAG: helix-turn-helix transcriptional regulator [Verrucomicrobiae bacterium]|nr:helix-turn-helix transcriptional regulator [Verrucomicrobiae bacterium]
MYHFARTFRARTGKSPWEFVQRVRMERARDLLVSTHRPIKEIGHAVGFRDYSYFCRMFWQHTGYTPDRLRQQA